MPLGYDQEQNIVNMGDTADLYAYIYQSDSSPWTSDDLVNVSFTIEKPDGTRTTQNGTIEDDGSGYLRFSDTDLEGEYRAVASFTLANGAIQSTRSDFEVQDPFDPPYPTPDETVTDMVWKKIQDCFDSRDGGPWMREMTLNAFSPKRIPDFIPEALLDINVTNPPTDLTQDYFTQVVNNQPNEALPLLTQATFLAVVRHLMRAYVEQPLAQGGQVNYEDRRDYLQRWGTIYQIEFQFYDHLVKMWKRQFLGLGDTKSIISNKAGRITPAPMRSRNIGRGYW